MAETGYTRDDEERIAEALRAGGVAVCPRCGGRLAREDLPPRERLAYVRTRVWLTCASCGRSALLDRRRVEPDR